MIQAALSKDLQEAIDFHKAVLAEGSKALVGYDTAKAVANVVLLSEIPTTYDEFVDVLDAFVVTGLVKSKGDARRLLQQGGLYANGEKLSPEHGVLAPGGAIHGQFYVLRKGAREIAIVRLAS